MAGGRDWPTNANREENAGTLSRMAKVNPTLVGRAPIHQRVRREDEENGTMVLTVLIEDKIAEIGDVES